MTIIGATKIPELAAGVVFYGIPPEQAAKPADVKIPLQAHFANKDDWCTPQVVDAFEKGMKAAGKSLELFRYDAEHAFVNEQRQSVHDRRPRTGLGQGDGVFQEASRVKALLVIATKRVPFFAATDAIVCAKLRSISNDGDRNENLLHGRIGLYRRIGCGASHRRRTSGDGPGSLAGKGRRGSRAGHRAGAGNAG